MTSMAQLWVTALVAVGMLILGVRADMLSLPWRQTRCGACGRLVARGSTCPCTRGRDD